MDQARQYLEYAMKNKQKVSAKDFASLVETCNNSNFSLIKVLVISFLIIEMMRIGFENIGLN